MDLLGSSGADSRWDRVFTVATALNTAMTIDGGLATNLSSGPGMNKLEAALLMSLASFCEMLEKNIEEGGMFGSDTGPMQLAVAVTSLCAVVQTMLPHGGTFFADSLLDSPGLGAALLCAAAMAPHSRPGPDLKLVSFAILQTRRTAGELLATILEYASTDRRVQTERAMMSVSFEPAGSRLVQALVLSHPDPKLHEVLLELLWRSLRRFDLANPADKSPALNLLQRIAGKDPCQRLRDVKADDCSIGALTLQCS
jgi:hypothetical protein